MEYKRPWLKDSGIKFKTLGNYLQKISSALHVNLHKNRTIEPFKKEYCVHKTKVTRTISFHHNCGVTESKEFSLSYCHTQKKIGSNQPRSKDLTLFKTIIIATYIKPGPLQMSWEHLWKNCPNKKTRSLQV